MTIVGNISDIHSGAHEGLRHPDSGELNPIQTKLWKEWLSAVTTMNKRKLDVLVINGDACDGHNTKGNGIGCWTTDNMEQAEWASKIINMVDAKEYIFVEGSGYHSNVNASNDRLTSLEVESLGKKSNFKGEDFILSRDGCRIYYRHSIGNSIHPTSLSWEILWARIHEEDYGHIDGLVFGHLHFARLLTDFSQFALQLPGWKARDAFVRSRTLRYNPYIGFVTYELDNGTYRFLDTVATPIQKQIPEM